MVPVEPTGLVDLGEIFYPKQWRVAYGVTAVKAAEAGAYELRLTTSDGVKVWVNDKLVFANRKLTREAFDGLVIPINLASGTNRILVKSIQSKGSWRFFGRITAKGGELLGTDRIEQVFNDAPVGAEARQLSQTLVELDTLLDRKLSGFFRGSTRCSPHLLARRLGLRRCSQVSEAVSRRYPDAIYFMTLLAYALWDNRNAVARRMFSTSWSSRLGRWPRIELLQAFCSSRRCLTKRGTLRKRLRINLNRFSHVWP